MSDVVRSWSQKFGLAVTPLFEQEHVELPGEHNILLDGGLGTFALSESEEEIWKAPLPAAWIWSSNIPHHVTVTNDKVAVVRWDKPADARTFSRNSIEKSLGNFYNFLTEDRLRSSNTVVDHLLSLFRRIRALNFMATKDDLRSTDAFAAVLATLISADDARADPNTFGLREDAFEVYDRLDKAGVEAALSEVKYGGGSIDVLKLYPSLAIRHASGLLFQEAHFQLLRASSSLDLFGLANAPEVKPLSRGGTHFTPPALARSVVEQAFLCISDLSTREFLTICDPACGSGAFLHEALRTLRAKGYKGHLRILGQDISAPAISMAKFVIHMSLRDWSPLGGVEVRLTQGDSLAPGGMPTADVILMNPPFLAFGAQNLLQREQLRDAIGSEDAARGDLSMAFILRALKSLNTGGSLGTLFPAGLLSSKSATSWREKLRTAGNIKLLASIGDFGLFAHAMVRIACLVAEKPVEVPSRNGSRQLIALVTENDQRVTGDALRHVRRIDGVPPAIAIEEEGWNLFAIPMTALERRPTWNLITPSNERTLQRLRENLPTVGDFFDVGQGIQTGHRAAFLLPEKEWQSLPLKERKYFRAAIMSDSIQGGAIKTNYWLFFPHTAAGPLFSSEDAVRKAAPEFFERYLLPNKAILLNRASIVRARREDWWGLMHPRKWSFETGPRILSKFFAGEGGFACDIAAKFLPVTGHIWLPKPILVDHGEDELPLETILRAYTAIFNSKHFVKLLSFHSPHVAGGQFDLSLRHVSPIPVPNLRQASLDPELGQVVMDLASSEAGAEKIDKLKNQRLVAKLYGKESANIF